MRALVFPGQGAQYVGMGRELMERYPEARALMDQAETILAMPLARICGEGPEAELVRTDVSQPAILVVSLMALAVLRARRGPIDAAATAGLSLGEYTALVAAGALAAEDAIRLVRLRGQAMQAAAELVPGGMVALIGADEVQAQTLCAGSAQGAVLEVANLNSTGQVVISGAVEACQRAMEQAKGMGIRKCVALNVAGAFHSALMAPAADRLRQALEKVTFRDPQIPVYANVHAGPVTRAAEIPALLVAQLTRPVRWAQSVQAMQGAGISEFWELGPGRSISAMIARTVAGTTQRNLDHAGDLDGFPPA